MTGRPVRQEGLALVMAMAAVAILAALLADMHESTGTALAISVAEREQLQAEYLAKSGLNLTRLMVSQEPQVRQLLTPVYQLLVGRAPPQIPVWKYADMVLQPFCNPKEAERNLGLGAFSLTTAKGIGDLAGICEISAVAENSRINANDPVGLDGDAAKVNVALQFFGSSGGYRSPSPFDNLFAQRDPDGLFSSRLDVLAAIVDWWDIDNDRTVFDPGTAKTTSAGVEEEPYASFKDPYRIKNAPFDSLEELRLVRGMSDDLWSTLVDPDPDDPEARLVTVYGPGSLNPNEAAPELLLARVCSAAKDQSLCIDPLEAAKFVQIIRTARMIAPIPFFIAPEDFLNFMEGKGGERDLYPLLKSFLGDKSALLFKPITIAKEARQEMLTVFVPSASILTIQSTGRVGRSRVRIRAVVNFDPRWTPPPPNAGRMPGLGILHHYRID